MINLKHWPIVVNGFLQSYLPMKDREKMIHDFRQLFDEDKKKIVEVSMEGLAKVYPNGIKALDNLSFQIKPQEFIVLLGPSGCGKTTLLRMIAGLESISDGYIKFDNTVINSVPPKDRELAMVFQNYALYPFMTVQKNIAFGIKNKARNNNTYKQLVRAIKIAKNPCYDAIMKCRMQIKMLSHLDDALKDDILRHQRLLRTAGRRDQNYQTLRKKHQELLQQKRDFLNDPDRKSALKNFRDQLQKLRQKNKQLRRRKSTEINQQVAKLLREKYYSVRVWRNNIPQIIERVTKLLDINLYINRRPAELSGGQRQRVALARAISKKVGLYLYDEPLSNLDAKLRATMRKEIRKIHDRMQSTSVYVTHDQIEAMSMADRIVVMHKGYIQQIGTPKQLIETPLNLFVARFIGNAGVNVFGATHVRGTTFKINQKQIVLPKFKSTFDPKVLKRKIMLGIRPEHIITEPQLVSNIKQNKFKGQIIDLEILGNDVLVTVKVKTLGSIQMIFPLARGLVIGETVAFAFNGNKTYIYDKQTGYNLLVKFDQENETARQIWVNGESERNKNRYLMHKEKNHLSLTAYVRSLIFALFSAKARQRLKNRHQKLPPSNEKMAQ